MKGKRMGLNPLDYSEDKVEVTFVVADLEGVKESLQTLFFIEKVTYGEFDFVLWIATQQIPEVIRHLAEKNIAIYAVVPKSMKW